MPELLTPTRGASRRAFLLRRVHSLSGALPLGGFLILHLWTSAHALNGQSSYETAVLARYDWPLHVVLELLFLYVPLIFHAGYGFVLIAQSRPNVTRFRFASNWGHLMQRVTGLIALAFVVLHVWQLRIPVLLGEMRPEDLFPELCASLSSTVWGGVPLNAVLYLVGIAAIAFHFSNGLSGFCTSWGITVSERATRLASALFGVLGLVLFAYGALTVIYFATGAAPTLLGARSRERAVACQAGGALSPAAHLPAAVHPPAAVDPEKR